MAKSERDKEVEIYQKALSRSVKLEALKNTTDWEVVDDVINSLITDVSNELLNGSALDHDTYLIKRAQLDGIRAVQGRFNKILKDGQQAADSLKQIEG